MPPSQELGNLRFFIYSWDKRSRHRRSRIHAGSLKRDLIPGLHTWRWRQTVSHWATQVSPPPVLVFQHPKNFHHLTSSSLKSCGTPPKILNFRVNLILVFFYKAAKRYIARCQLWCSFTNKLPFTSANLLVPPYFYQDQAYFKVFYWNPFNKNKYSY